MLEVKLVVVGGATEGDEFQLELPAVLGRSRDATIPLPHPLVSRRHCQLVEKQDRLFVQDLGSTNGTFVGSERVEESYIDHGALLTIGTVTFRAQYAGLSVVIESSAGTELPEHQDSGDRVLDTSTITRIDTGNLGGKPQPVARRIGQRAK